jgi:hypothetical protein
VCLTTRIVSELGFTWLYDLYLSEQLVRFAMGSSCKMTRTYGNDPFITKNMYVCIYCLLVRNCARCVKELLLAQYELPFQQSPGRTRNHETTVKRTTNLAKIWTRDLRGSRSRNPWNIKLHACSLTAHSVLITCVVESSAVFNSCPTPIMFRITSVAHIYDRSNSWYHEAHLSLALVNGLGAREHRHV